MLELRLTNNHYSMISVRRKPDGYRLRLHRMFVGAEPRTVRALARYVVHNDRRASTLLGELHRAAPAHHPPAEAAPAADAPAHGGPVSRPAGDLRSAERRALRGRARGAHHLGPGDVARQRRRSIKMGSFAVEDRIIRIHPALDQDCVPDYFVAWIVFHEMLHGKHEVKRENGRRRFHSAEFLAEERTFPGVRARLRLGEGEPRSPAARLEHISKIAAHPRFARERLAAGGGVSISYSRYVRSRSRCRRTRRRCRGRRTSRSRSGLNRRCRAASPCGASRAPRCRRPRRQSRGACGR